MVKMNHTTYAILGLLTAGCHTGYDVKQMMDNSLNHFWKISYGQIYPTLRQLADEGFAEVSTANEGGKPDRKEYVITERGKEALEQWVSGPLSSLPTERNELLLKLFFSRHQPAEKAIAQVEAYLNSLQERYNAYLTIEHSILSSCAFDADAKYGLITLEYGKKVTKAAIEWCEHTIQQLEEEE
ncbi:PadR family transcriptional regulator [Halobacillus salinarum]|uniref:PadR family transcriptional regulator n=1 Tax=Halobacillus salinarum TaxID=2932257 RepID=A0ABY4EES5_9BACI|nr:PadR family transcriptional regulator [Halobacillus salinarum]UOQ42968.1 PadR family transcriptional regulator [Halobacillus salinarum]